jgi:hypothetical protein
MRINGLPTDMYARVRQHLSGSPSAQLVVRESTASIEGEAVATMPQLRSCSSWTYPFCSSAMTTDQASAHRQRPSSIAVGVECVEATGDSSRGPVEERPVVPLDHADGCAHHPCQLKDADPSRESVGGKRRAKVVDPRGRPDPAGLRRCG